MKPDYTSNAGLKFGPNVTNGAKGDCMKIHAVEGYRLSRIKIRGYDTATTYVVSSAMDGTNPLIDPQTIATTCDSILELNLTGSVVNTDYYLIVTDKGAAIREMWITYEPVR